MEMQAQKIQNQKKDEEDLLNFDLDDISLEDIDQQPPGQEEEIIELTELVARGEPLGESVDESAGAKVGEGVSSDESGGFELPDDDLAGLEPLVDASAGKTEAAVTDADDFALELDVSGGRKEAGPELKKEDEFVTAAELEAILKEEEPLELIPDQGAGSEKEAEEVIALSDLIEEEKQTEPKASDALEDDLLKDEDPALEIAPEKRTPKMDVPSEKPEAGQASPPVAAAAPAPPDQPVPLAITEERLEAIVTKVVQDVLERVARETMCSVAERVIGEAIESLKRSLSENP